MSSDSLKLPILFNIGSGNAPHMFGAKPLPEPMLTSYFLDPRDEREIKFIGLFEERGHRGPYSPYKPCNHNLYIGIIIFPHIDNPQYAGYD